MSLSRNLSLLAVDVDSSGNLSGETYSTNAAVSAAGTNQGTGTALTNDLNVITTAASGTGVVLPTATVGRRIIVVNKGANAVLVYGAGASAIDTALSSISIPVAGWMEFNASSITQWYSTYNITAAGGGGGSFTSTDDTTTNATYYPLAATSAGGSSAVTSSTKLTFNPSTGTLGATIFNSLSDITKKTDIIIIDSAISTINKIEGVEFNWVDNGYKSAGVIAQQLEQILPHLVETDTEGLKSVNYNGIIGYLIQSVKELSAKVDSLENR
jgi:hypothetical protein